MAFDVSVPVMSDATHVPLPATAKTCPAARKSHARAM